MAHRLLLFTTDLERGGTPTVVRELATRLRNPRVEVEVACIGRFGPVAQELVDRNIRVWALGARGTMALPRVVEAFGKLMGTRHYDRVLSFLMHANVVSALASIGRRKNTRWFQSVQTTQPYPWWHWKLQRLAADACERVIVPSHSVARMAVEAAGVAESKIVVIPNAVDPIPEATKLDRKVIRVGFVGRLDPVKRVQDLIAAVATLPPRFRLDIFGDGPERATLQQLGIQLKDRCTFHGMVRDVPSIYQQLDLLVLPSDAEGLPMVLIEAMSAGVGVIGANSPGIVDVIDHQKTGLLYPPRDVTGLARAIELSTTPAASRYRTAASACARDRFGWAAVLDAYGRVLGLDPA